MPNDPIKSAVTSLPKHGAGSDTVKQPPEIAADLKKREREMLSSQETAKGASYEDELAPRTDADLLTKAATAETIAGSADSAKTILPGTATTLAEPGSALGRIGVYELLEKLGEGGMGAVYKARHTKLGRIMAVKVLSHHALKDANAIARFEREMLAVGTIHHPNIVQAFDAGDANGVHYLAMEYVEGRDLQVHLADKGPLSVVSACKVIQQAAKGMAAAHSLGLVHRDLKPGNLFVTKSGQVKVLDLGLALVPSGENQTALTSHGSWFGTPDYMAPEQWESTHHVDARADLYALGCTLFCLLVGRPPYGTEVNATTASKMIAHSVNESPDLQVARPDVPPELALLYKRLMAKKPEDRLATAQELVEQLNPFVTKKDLSGIKATAPSSPLPLVQVPAITRTAAANQPPQRRWRTAVAASGGAAVLLMLGLIVITIVNKDGQKSVIHVPEGIDTHVHTMPGSKVTISQELGGPTTPKAHEHVGWHGWPSDAPAPAISPFDTNQARQHQDNWAKYLGVPVEYSNSIGMKFRLIPPGEFNIGTTDEDIEDLLKEVLRDFRNDSEILTGTWRWGEMLHSESPKHLAILTQPFYIGTYEVTQGEYIRISGRNPSSFSHTGVESKQVEGLDTLRFPVDSIAREWEQCNQLSRIENLSLAYVPSDSIQVRGRGIGYRLPTNYEWEYACRAGTLTAFSSGDTLGELQEAGWTAMNANGRTHEVGKLSPNPFGLFDMHGNVSEWIEDGFDKNTYQINSTTTAINPLTPHDWGPDKDMIRGGSYCSPTLACRSAFRGISTPHIGWPEFGMRMVLSVDAVRQLLNSGDR